MARCERCFACENMFDMSACKYCGFPNKETRSPDKIKEDNEYRLQWEKEQLGDEEETI